MLLADWARKKTENNIIAEAPPAVNVSGNSATVISSNQFIVTPIHDPFQVQYINVSYILDFVFQNNTFMISNEVWHITGSGLISFAQESYEYDQVSNLAFSHWNNIAIENTSLVMQQYASNSTLHWLLEITLAVFPETFTAGGVCA